MRLTYSTDLALRALMLAAARRHRGIGGAHGDSGAHRGSGDREDGQERLTVRDLADALEVPTTHMAKIVQRLQRLGLVITVRGRAGGVLLAPDAPQVSVGQVVRALEGPGEIVSCAEPPCPLRDACRLRAVLRQAQDSFLATLDTVRLADLIASPAHEVLLSLGPPGRAAEAAPV